MLQAIIFDMDDVLVNSTPYIWESFNRVLKKDGVQLSREDVKRYLGISLRDQLISWKERFNIKDYSLEEFSKKAWKIQMELLRQNIKLDENLKQFLIKAKEENIRLSVATSSAKWRAEIILKLLDIYDQFEVVVGAEDIEKHKPHPDVFLEAAKRLNVDPSYCVVFEDAPMGIEAAKKGQMKVVGKITEFQSAEDLSAADLIINDFSEINIKKLGELFV